MHEQLEKPIAQWRQTLAEQIGSDAKILDELEGHLRDEIDRLLALGQLPEQAFAAAALKVGTPEKIASEFAKLAAPWWPIRAVVFGIFGAIACLFVLVGVRALRDADLEAPNALLAIHVVSVTVGYLLTYGIGVLALCYGFRRSMRELTLGQQTSLVRAFTRMTWLALSLTLIGFLTGCAWAHEQWGRFFDFWDVRETGALSVLCWQAVLLGSAAYSRRSLRWLMCWGVFGILAVTYAWFVTAYLSDLRRYHFLRNTLIPVLATATPILLAIMASGLLRTGWLRRFLVYAFTNAVKRLQRD